MYYRVPYVLAELLVGAYIFYKEILGAFSFTFEDLNF